MVSPEKFSPKKDLFEEQWRNPEEIVLSGDKVKIYDIKPEQQKTEVPVVFVPGWSGTPGLFKGNIQKLVELGRRTISVGAPHGIEIENEKPPKTEQEIPEAELRKVTALIGGIEYKNLKKVDVVSHSEGGAVAVFAATLYPEKFRNLVLVEPAGMIGQDNFWRLMKDFSIDNIKSYIESMKDEELKKVLLESAVGNVEGMPFRHPILAFREAVAMSKIQIQKLLRGLKKNGIGISIVHGVDDQVFPMERVQQTLETEKNASPILNMIDGFYSVKGRHPQFQLEPDAYTRLAEQALSDMEKKSQKNN